MTRRTTTTAEEHAYAEHVLRLAWLRGCAWQLFALEEEGDEPMLARFGPGGLGRLAAVLLDHADAAQILSTFPSTDDLHGDYPPSERVS